MSHLTLRAVTKTFADVTAVDELDLAIEDGETVVLLGPSGCGKTTCLRMMAGFERPDAGEIVLADETLASPTAFVPPEKRHMAVVFQSYALWPHMTVFDNVAFGPTTAGTDRAETRRRVLEVLELVQLTGYGDRYPHQLSGGQQQRVALARALVTRPRLLLMDEPLSNLDTRLREEMRHELKRLQQLLDVTMVYVTHDQAEALSLADRIVVMNRGRVEQVGTPTEVYRHPDNGYVARALGATNIVPADVLAANGTTASVRLFGGLEVEVDTGKRGSLQGTHRALVSVRPASIRLEQPDGIRPSATVTEAMFFGDVVQYSVDVPTCPGPLKITGSGDNPHRPGDELSLGVAPSAIAVLTDQPPASPSEGHL